VHTLVDAFSAFQPFIPWIALALLGYIGGKMVYEGVRGCEGDACKMKKLGFVTLMVQGVATSIDALSVGFTISEYNFLQALICATIIALVTFAICFVGLVIGKKAGDHLADRAEVFGGAILIFIGLEIFITGII
jgi:putative Mn2+ efflux pump MntP